MKLGFGMINQNSAFDACFVIIQAREAFVIVSVCTQSFIPSTQGKTDYIYFSRDQKFMDDPGFYRDEFEL